MFLELAGLFTGPSNFALKNDYQQLTLNNHNLATIFKALSIGVLPFTRLAQILEYILPN